MTKKEEFYNNYKNFTKTPEYLIVAVKIVNITEVIINCKENIESKMEYYMLAYDDDLVLNTNKNISIVKYMFV